MGVVNDSRLETLATDLRSAGFNQFTMMSHDDLADQIEAISQRSNPLMRLMDELKSRHEAGMQFLEQYEDEARAGKHIIAVKAQRPEEARRVRDILERNKVLDIRYFEALTQDTPSSESTIRRAP